MIKIGQCISCNEFFPPEFTILKERKLDGKDLYKCYFCERGVTNVQAKNENGETYTYTKGECIKDYKKFIKMIRETPGVSESLAKNKLKFNLRN